MPKRIAVLGSGANGASIGADLTRAGVDVVLIDQWPEHVAAMRQNGIRIDMPGETQTTAVRAFNLCDVCTFTEPFDVVLLLMKAYDTRWACQLIEPYLKASGLVAGVQNGMTTDVIADVVGPQRLKPVHHIALDHEWERAWECGLGRELPHHGACPGACGKHQSVGARRARCCVDLDPAGRERTPG